LLFKKKYKYRKTSTHGANEIGNDEEIISFEEKGESVG